MALDLAMVFASDPRNPAPRAGPYYSKATGSTNGSAKAGSIEIESTRERKLVLLQVTLLPYYYKGPRL